MLTLPKNRNIFRNFPTFFGKFWKTWTSKQSNSIFLSISLNPFLRVLRFIKIIKFHWSSQIFSPCLILNYPLKPPQQSSPSSFYAGLECIVDWQITSIIFIFNRFFLLLNLFWGYRRWMELIVCLQIIMNANIFISNAQLSHLNGTCFGFKIQYSESWVLSLSFLICGLVNTLKKIRKILCKEFVSLSYPQIFWEEFFLNNVKKLSRLSHQWDNWIARNFLHWVEIMMQLSTVLEIVPVHFATPWFDIEKLGWNNLAISNLGFEAWLISPVFTKREQKARPKQSELIANSSPADLNLSQQ